MKTYKKLRSILAKTLIFNFAFTTYTFASVQKREVLALWQKNDFTHSYEQTYTHKFAETILNHFGYKVIYRDITKGITEDMSDPKFYNRFSHILTWFSKSSIYDANQYLSWSTDRVREGKKFIILGNFGFFKSEKNNKDTSLGLINKFLSLVGLETNGNYIPNPVMLDIVSIDKLSLEFERKYKNEILKLTEVYSIDKSNKPLLKLKHKQNKKISTPVIHTKNLSYAQDSYEIFINPTNFSTEWRIDPFKFFKESLKIELSPIPDITTINGRRVFYTHIDGDGFISSSKVDKSKLCGEIIKEEIIEKYDMPITVSIIEAEISSEFRGTRESEKVAREIFKLDNVEMASHAFTHPLSWSQIPSKEEFILYKDFLKGGENQILAYPVKGYKLNYDREIRQSIEYIQNKLAPDDKKINLMLWSGNCLPPKEAMEIIYKNNYLNLNGGDTRFDNRFNSYSYVKPLYRQIGPYLQIYATNSNENTYPNIWAGSFAGFDELIETFERTEEPIRLRPMNIYYHFYSAEFAPALEALKKNYDYVQKLEYHPLYVSDYVKNVYSFVNTKLVKIDKTSFRIYDHQPLRTFRIETDNYYPDYQKSKNIIGHRFINNTLYLFTGSANDTYLKLTQDKNLITPYITSSGAQIDSFKFNGKNLILKGSSKINTQVEISNLPKNAKFKRGNKTHQVTKTGTLVIEVTKGVYTINMSL